MITFIQQGHIKLIKSDRKDMFQFFLIQIIIVLLNFLLIKELVKQVCQSFHKNISHISGFQYWC